MNELPNHTITIVELNDNVQLNYIIIIHCTVHNPTAQNIHKPQNNVIILFSLAGYKL